MDKVDKNPAKLRFSWRKEVYIDYFSVTKTPKMAIFPKTAQKISIVEIYFNFKNP